MNSSEPQLTALMAAFGASASLLDASANVASPKTAVLEPCQRGLPLLPLSSHSGTLASRPGDAPFSDLRDAV